ncbi:MAG: 50S ribosomal protein L6 [Deltaproteobacteria bacterium]|nr:50S ribosomal protein L6 [Deltaproteobacteria bacterium]
MGESRIGKKPVPVPKGVTVTVSEGLVTVSNGKQTLVQDFADVTVAVEGGQVLVKPANESQGAKARHGLYRSLIANMVEGLARGFVRRLEVQGIGYKVEMAGKDLKLTVGFSNPVLFPAPAGIELSTPNATTIEVKGVSKQLVGETAARLRRVRPPEPYKGKGIRYANEHVKKKVAKGK